MSMNDASDVEAMLDQYIYQYMRETNRQDCAEVFAREAGFLPSLDNEEPGRFLRDWWKFFIDTYAARYSNYPPLQATQGGVNTPYNVNINSQSPGIPTMSGYQRQRHQNLQQIVERPELMSGPVSVSNLNTSQGQIRTNVQTTSVQHANHVAPGLNSNLVRSQQVPSLNGASRPQKNDKQPKTRKKAEKKNMG